ncbi:MAG TPA: TonB-dependent receptor [Bryobacteraceae bacterium]|nr:TonB-dependent receptor [Bryobacteraceae bacterium]
MRKGGIVCQTAVNPDGKPVKREMTGKPVRFLMASLMSLAPCLAQDYRATVQGLISDSSNALVAGAQITLLNVKTGVMQTQPSNGQGEYRFALVEPGMYQVTGEMRGFRKEVAENVRVETSGDVTVNLTLQPGTLSQSVVVTANPVELQLNTSSKSLTITQEQIANLPVLDRSPFSLVLLDPAVQNNYPTTSTPFHMWQASEMDFGGRTSRANDVLIDGSPVQIGPKGSYTPTMDATQDVVVEQVAVDSEYGHSAGGVTNISTRQGTNDIHGVGYYYGRNPAIDAASNGLIHSPSLQRNSIWGGAVGGPIKKNKLFTYASYEGWRETVPYSPYGGLLTLPTALERTGDYSQSLNINGGLRTIYNPYTTQYDPATGVATRTPFAGNRIPASMLDPTAMKMMADIWQPNHAPTNIAGANNFQTTTALTTKYWNVSDRTDWDVSDKLKIFGRYSEFNATNELPDYTGINSPAAANGQGGVMWSRNVAGDVTYTFNPTLVGDFRMSYAAFNDNAAAPQNEIGASGLANLWPNNPWYQPYESQYNGSSYFPTLNIGPTPGSYKQFGLGSLYFQEPHSYNFNGKLAKTWGQHSIKTGIDSRYSAVTLSYPQQMAFNFTSATTANTFNNPNINLSGDPYATFLLGAPDNTSQAAFTPPANISLHYYGGYVQDDYKLSRRITLNVGLRYEFESAPVDSQNRYLRLLDLNAPNPVLATNPLPYTAADLALRAQYLGAGNALPAPNGQYLFADGTSRSPFHAPIFNFAPRVGGAIQLNDKTVLQLGWGRNLMLNSQVYNGLLTNPNFTGYSQTSTIQASVNGVPQTQLSNPYPSDNPLVPVTGKSLGVNTNLGGSFNGNNYVRYPNYQDGSLDRFNATIERQLPGQFRLDVSFIGINGRNIDSNTFFDNAFPLNQVNPALYYNPQTGGRLVGSVANPFYNYLTRAQFSGGLRSQKTVQLQQLLAPYPQYQQILMGGLPIEGDVVRNFEVQMQRAYSNGFTILGSYLYNREWQTWFPSAGDPTGGLYYYNRTPVWSDSTGSPYARHRTIISGVYDIPFGRGRAMMANANRLVDGMLGDWTLSSTFTFNAGAQISFGNGFEVVGNPAQNVPAGYAFNPAAFETLPLYTPTEPVRNFPGVTAPNFWNIDASLAKTFPITERWKLQFRMEAYNLTNSIMFAPADANFGDSSFGQVNLNQSNTGRTLQYAARLSF